MSTKGPNEKFNKIHDFNINMAHYINQNADNFDLGSLNKIYVFKPNVLFENDKTALKVWIDIEIGDKSNQSTKDLHNMSSHMDQLLASIADESRESSRYDDASQD